MFDTARISHRKKIVLQSTDGCCDRLETLVAQFIHDRAAFVGVVGKDCKKIEEIIDELCVGDATHPYDMLTSSHPDQSVEEALAFANTLRGKLEGVADLILLSPLS